MTSQAEVAPEPGTSRLDGGRVALVAGMGWIRGSRLPGHVVVLTVLITLLFLMFLLIEPSPRWLVLFGAGVTALAVDGVLRTARQRPFQLGTDTTPHLFLPVLYVLAVPVFIEEEASGFLVVPLGLVGGMGLGAVVLAEIGSVRDFDPQHTLARLVATIATYFVAFALFSLTYSFDLELPAAPLAVGLIGLLLAVELVREGEVDPRDTLAFAVVVGLVTGEVRVALHYLPLDGNLAAVALLLTFFASAGLLAAHAVHRLSRRVLAEYAALAVAGFAAIAIARAAGVG